MAKVTVTIENREQLIEAAKALREAGHTWKEISKLLLNSKWTSSYYLVNKRK